MAALTPGLIEYLGTFVSENKRGKIDKILRQRTRFLTVVLEDIYQPHNASAVLRSCECFGVQDVHIVEGRNRFEINRDVALGAGKWLSLHRYGGDKAEANLDSCLSGLKQRGYRVVAATPHADDCPLDELAMDKPVAVLLGTEELGLSPAALAQADAYIKIPMFGFTESFNISVSAALILRELSRSLRSAPVDWRLGPEQEEELRLEWYRKIVRGSDLIEARYRADNGYDLMP
jgi:tRNA (guanosine-2'-O-)-methyltransferase